MTPRSGDPMVTLEPADNGAVIVTMTVASVGPYAFRSAPDQRSVSSGGQMSPPTTTECTVSSPAGSTVIRAVGVITTLVMRSVWISSASSLPPNTSCGDTISVAPAVNAASNSPTDVSKLGEATCRKRDEVVTS